MKWKLLRRVHTDLSVQSIAVRYVRLGIGQRRKRGQMESKIDNYFIYALVLGKGKIYVGKTKSSSNRMIKHLRTKGTFNSWPYIYGVVDILIILPIPKTTYYHKYEDSLAYVCAMKFGVENVRGGFLCNHFSDKKCQMKMDNFILDREFIYLKYCLQHVPSARALCERFCME
jgi:predicted GIY-YIG superfamily endonuclease